MSDADLIEVTLALPRAVLSDFLEEQSLNEETHALPWQRFSEHLSQVVVEDSMQRHMQRERARTR